MAATAPGRVLAEVDLSDMSKGMYRAGNREDAPPGSAFDITNGLIQDDGRVFRRGGSAYKSTSTGLTIVFQLSDVAFNAGNRTVFQGNHVLDVDDSTSLSLGGNSPAAMTAAVKVGNYLVIPGATTTANVYAGSRKTASYTTGTVSINGGSRVLTGVGTSWLANADAGMILSVTGFNKKYTIQSIDSNTTATLDTAWTEANAAGAVYSLAPLGTATPNNVLVPVSGMKVASVATRLAFAVGNYVGLSDINDPFTYTSGSYLVFSGAVLGLANVRETLLVFTTGGMYAVSGLANSTPSDAAGNAQWTRQLVNAELICWSHEGIASWAGSAVVPCLDGLWLVDPTSGPKLLSRNITDLWRSYTSATGYKAGIPAVINGHYLVPILAAGTSWTDSLVCRLDSAAWTRLAGAGAQVTAFAARRSNPPQLLGALSSGSPNARLVRLDYWTPSVTIKSDHDGTAHVLDITTRDIQGPGDQQNLFDRIRAWWTGTVDSGSPTVGATGQRLKDGSPTTLQGSNGTTYTAISDGSTYNWWDVSKMGKQIRFRITTSGSLSTFVLNKLIALILPSGGE